MYSFIDVMIDCLNYVRSVALSGAALNPSWHLTAVGPFCPRIRLSCARLGLLRSRLGVGRVPIFSSAIHISSFSTQSTACKTQNT
jgi:hypothetical protein